MRWGRSSKGKRGEAEEVIFLLGMKGGRCTYTELSCPAILYILTSYLYYSETLPSCNSAELFFSEQQDGLAGWGVEGRESGQGEGTPVKIGIFELSFSLYFSRDSLYIPLLAHELDFCT